MANDPYEIKFELADEIKNLVGKTLVIKGRELQIVRWEGKNLIIADPASGKEGAYPAMYIRQQIISKAYSIK